MCKKASPEASAGSLLRDPLSWLNVQLLLDSVSGLLRWLDYLRFLITRSVGSRPRGAPDCGWPLRWPNTICCALSFEEQSDMFSLNLSSLGAMFCFRPPIVICRAILG